MGGEPGEPTPRGYLHLYAYGRRHVFGLLLMMHRVAVTGATRALPACGAVTGTPGCRSSRGFCYGTEKAER
eukprot:4917257-Prymnesium_polylepis.2